MARYDGDGSYRKLIANAYGIGNRFITQLYEEYNDKVKIDDSIKHTLMSFFRFGGYNWNIGGLNARSSEGYFWENIISSYDEAYLLSFYSVNLNLLSSSFNKGFGFSLRCVAKCCISNLLMLILFCGNLTFC